jgi:hypothetical protein
MPILELPSPVARRESFIPDSGVRELDVQSEVGREIRRVAREALIAGAGQILRGALERYRRPDGYEGYLVEAAWQLEQLGREAWPVLRDLILAGGHECEYFLSAVGRLDGVAPQHRLMALLAAARNPDANVRSRLLELIEEMPNELREKVLRELSAEGRPDDSVTDRAREAWHEQAS